MEKPGALASIICTLGTIMNLLAFDVGQGVKQNLERNSTDFQNAVGNIVEFFLILIFWLGFAMLAALLLLLGKLFIQHMIFVVVNALLVVGQWYYVAYPLYDLMGGSLQEKLISLVEGLFPLLLMTLLVILGFINRNKD